MRLIDADELLVEMGAGCIPIGEKGISGVTGDESTIKDYVDAAPTIDAVEVVRCRECRHHYESAYGHIVCELLHRTTRVDGYCHNGKRKMDAEVQP